MKTTNRILLGFFILTLLAATVTLIYVRFHISEHVLIEGSGNIVTETREIEDFYRLEVSGNIGLTLIQGNYPGLLITTDDNLLEFVSNSYSNGKLSIDSRRITGNHKRIEVELVYVSIEELNAIAGANITSVDTITAETFKHAVTGGAFSSLVVVSGKVDMNATAGAHANLSGYADVFTVSANAGSQVRAGDFVAKEVEARATSGSSIHVYASEKIEARANSGASIRFSGDPGVRNISSSSGGSVSAQ